MLTKDYVEEDTLRENNNIMKHRGPDSSGYWISKNKKTGLSQTRLSIVDLDSRSNQPMIIDNNITLVFNGEIYNYLELRKDLEKKYKFRTTSDTEVLGYAYKEYGKKLLSKIEGMFAFAIYDKEADSMFIARDFVGQKPLIYTENEKGFFFASEIPVILHMVPEERNNIDYSALSVYLTSNFHHIPSPFTAFRNIKKINPSTYIIVKNGKIIESSQYYKLKKKEIKKEKEESEIIFNIIKQMKPRDITFSSFLSGGNDSSFVCAGLRQDNKSKIEVYTLKVNEKDEDFERSKYVCKKLSLNQTTVNFNENDFLKSITSQVRIYGEPYYHITSIYSDYLLKEVKKKHKVIFTGAGGDEVYYGYDNLKFIGLNLVLNLKKVIPSFVVRLILGKKYEFISKSNIHNIKTNYYLQNYEQIKKIINSEKNKVENKFNIINKYIFDQAEIKNYLDLTYMMGLFVENSHSLTIQSDLVGMKNSVEIRCPFLEKVIIERGHSLPLRKKVSIWHIREGKKILKNALVKILSRKFVYSRKIGFGVELNTHQNIIKKHKTNIKRKIKSLSNRDFFNKEELLKYIESEKIMQKNFTFIMKLYALEIWFETIEKTPYTKVIS